ncbi:MAG: hypothetical protein AAGF12_05380 [Myxococcota bacterium]
MGLIGAALLLTALVLTAGCDLEAVVAPPPPDATIDADVVPDADVTPDADVPDADASTDAETDGGDADTDGGDPDGGDAAMDADI